MADTDAPAWLTAGETVDRSALRRARDELAQIPPADAPSYAAPALDPSSYPPQPPPVDHYGPASFTDPAPQAYPGLDHLLYGPAPSSQTGAVSPVPPTGLRQQPPPAGLGARFAASLVDGLILFVPMGVLGFVAQLLDGGASAYGDPSAGAIVVSLLAYAVVIVYPIWGWSRGQTLGMRALHIELVDQWTLEHVGVGRAILRYLMTAVMGLPCYLGYLSIPLESRSGYFRGWNDAAANSRMIRTQ